MMEAQRMKGLYSFMIHGLVLLILSNINAKCFFASAQITPCQAPLQWEGRMVKYNHTTGRNTRAFISYDATMQRMRILEERKSMIPCRRFFEYIFLYKDAVMFQIEQTTKSCSKNTLTEPWDPYDVPENSTFEDHYYIGGPGDQITVQEWSDRKPARQHEKWVGVYSDKDCYPVQETYMKNESMTTSTRFFDIVLGIQDPSVFNPPTTCQTANPVLMNSVC
uniref:Mammalian ependymin-related protein 1 n=1 Tax=Leptobrachium leishanense TaxID=445787 RepID=A0A8C5MZZ6_9ANUR